MSIVPIANASFYEEDGYYQSSGNDDGYRYENDLDRGYNSDRRDESEMDYNSQDTSRYHSSYHQSSNYRGQRNSIRVNLGNLTWEAFDDRGELVNSGRVSGGKSYCPDIHRGCRTVTGTFTIHSKRGAGCKSTRFPVGKGGAPMPYCMFFHGGYALHGSYQVPNFNASHGCVRMPPDQARWLNQNFVVPGRTRVTISY